MHVSGWKGHNWDHDKGDVCKKCGEVHIHPRGMLGKSNKGIHKGKSPWSKGLTKETDERLAERGRKISATKKLRPQRHSAETRRKISENSRRMWQDPSFKQRLREIQRIIHQNPKLRQKLSRSAKLTWFAKHLKAIEEAYKLKLTVPPASLRDHQFVRLVLIEKTAWYDYVEFTGLLEHQYSPLRYPGDQLKIDSPILTEEDYIDT